MIQDTLISDVLIISMLISFCASTENIFAATPGDVIIPAPTIDTFATLVEEIISDMKRFNESHDAKTGRFAPKSGSGVGSSGAGWGYQGFHETANKLSDALNKANTSSAISRIAKSAREQIKAIDKELENPEGDVARLKMARYKLERIIKDAKNKGYKFSNITYNKNKRDYRQE